MDFLALLVLPLALGLLGFIEPSTVGSSLLFVKYFEGKEAAAKVMETAVFAASAGRASVAQGLWVMAVFGLALSLPLVVAVFWGRARHWLDRLASFTHRVPFWTGVVFVVLGAWSVYLGIQV